MTTWPGRVQERGGGSLGQPVGVEQVDAEIVEVARDYRIEARASGDEVAHVRAEGCVNFAKEEFARIEVETCAAKRFTRIKQRRTDSARRPRFADFLKDALVDQVEELRDDGEGGDLAFLQRAQ